MDLPEYKAAIQQADAVQEQVAAAEQEVTDLQEQKAELEQEMKSLSGTVRALKAAERVRVDFDTIRPEKTLTGAIKGVTVEEVKQLKAVAMRGAMAEQTVTGLKKRERCVGKRKCGVAEESPICHGSAEGGRAAQSSGKPKSSSLE